MGLEVSEQEDAMELPTTGQRSLPVLSSYAIAGHFHNNFALKAAQTKLGAWGSPGSGAVWGCGVVSWGYCRVL